MVQVSVVTLVVTMDVCMLLPFIISSHHNIIITILYNEYTSHNKLVLKSCERFFKNLTYRENNLIISISVVNEVVNEEEL